MEYTKRVYLLTKREQPVDAAASRPHGGDAGLCGGPTPVKIGQGVGLRQVHPVFSHPARPRPRLRPAPHPAHASTRAPVTPQRGDGGSGAKGARPRGAVARVAALPQLRCPACAAHGLPGEAHGPGAGRGEHARADRAGLLDARVRGYCMRMCMCTACVYTACAPHAHCMCTAACVHRYAPCTLHTHGICMCNTHACTH